MTEATAATPSKRRVLVADDEQVIANTLAIILNQAGFEAAPSTAARPPSRPSTASSPTCSSPMSS